MIRRPAPPTETYPGKYREWAISVEYYEDEVMIWVGNGGGMTFTKEQWTDLITKEAERLNV